MTDDVAFIYDNFFETQVFHNVHAKVCIRNFNIYYIITCIYIFHDDNLPVPSYIINDMDIKDFHVKKHLIFS